MYPGYDPKKDLKSFRNTGRFTRFMKNALRARREARHLEKLGYRRFETDWEIHRGFLSGGLCLDGKIVDVKISWDGKSVWTLLNYPLGGRTEEERKERYRLAFGEDKTFEELHAERVKKIFGDKGAGEGR